MSNLNLNSNANQNDNKRIFDYFIITSLPQKLTAKTTDNYKSLTREQHEKLLFQNLEIELNQSNHARKDPIVDIAILNRTYNEGIPEGYECFKYTLGGKSANLCGESIIKNSNEMYLLIRRGLDKPPIADIGVYYESGDHDKLVHGCEVIRRTIGDNCANLNTSSLYTDKIFITYSRTTDLACNSLAVVDVCVIAKGEQAPHSFHQIPKGLNRGIMGPSLFLSYKKSWIPAPQIKYISSILYRYPQIDHSDLPFPNEMASFGLPMGASIESWPKSSESNPNNVYICNLRPVFSTFVLNVNSDDGLIMEKVYGSTLTFYEDFDENLLNEDQCSMLNYTKNDPNQTRSLHSNKSLIILSRHPLFETYKHFLLFLFNKYTKKLNWKTCDELIIPIERYLSYLIFEVPFPTLQKPQVQVQLTEQETDCLFINLPTELVLPQSGASYIDMLYDLEVENSINVFVFALLQRNIMIHSLRRQALTSVVEAISSIIFPFIWRYSYLPMCPLSLCQLIDAPGSFIIGMDTRFFDMFEPPQNVLCIDLDTNTISWTADRQHVSAKILPKRVYNNLKTRLSQILTEIKEYKNERNSLKNPSKRQEKEFKKRLNRIDLSIREAFFKAMTQIMANYKTFLRTVTRRPDVKAIDRNISKFFDIEGFIRSKEYSSQLFYKELIQTQLFYDCIMNLSFTSELEPLLADAYAFFSDACTKITLNRDDEIKLILLNNSIDNQTVVMLPPVLDAEFFTQMNPDLSNSDPKDIILNGSAFIYDEKANSFPKLKFEVWLNQNSNTNSSVDLDASIGSKNLNENRFDTQSNSSSTIQNMSKKPSKMLNTPIGVRTKAEKIKSLEKMKSWLNVKPATTIKQAQKNYNTKAKLHAFCFLSNAYALWFMYLPQFIKECEDKKKIVLNDAYLILNRMQKHYLVQPDEICYRSIMQLCHLYKYPSLAVKTLSHMKKYKIDIPPITYSYYNKAVVDKTNWPSFENDKWAKIRVFFSALGKFHENLKIKRERDLKNKSKRRSKGHKKKKSKKMNRLKYQDNDEYYPKRPNTFGKSLDHRPEQMKQIFKSPVSTNQTPFSQLNLKYSNSILFDKSSGILFISQKLVQPRSTGTRKLQKTNSLPDMNKARHYIKVSFFSNDDPLKVFETPRIEKNFGKNDLEDVKRQLFRPAQQKSDFIYDKPAVIQEEKNVSYDSDMYSDEYEDSDDDDFYTDDSNDSVDFEGDDSDVEVDRIHSRSDKESNDLKISSESDNLSHSKVNGSTIEIENILIESSSVKRNTPEPNGNKSGFSSLLSTPFSSSRFSSFVKKIETSIGSSGSKLKDARNFLNEKTNEFKDAILSTTSQPEIASKIKSFSQYNIKTTQIITDFVKSTSTFSFNSDLNNLNGQSSKNNIENDLNSKVMQEMFNLDPLPNDDTFEPISLSWWNIDKSLMTDENSKDTMIEVQMSTCNFCDDCKSFLYDEEIMSGWTLNDSDLKIKCPRCSASIVPNIYIKIKDFENIKTFLNQQNDTLSSEKSLPENDQNSHPFDLPNLNNITLDEKTEKSKNSISSTAEFTVQYLSPLVVRKEFENIIDSESQENDENCFIDEKFMNEHSAIFWNLIWYFKRIGIDSSYLETILLNSRIKCLANELGNQIEETSFNEHKNLIGSLSVSKYHYHPNVRINCMWDNLKLHNDKPQHEIPLYLNWLHKCYASLDLQSKDRLITVLTYDELQSLRKTSMNSRSLSKLFELIVRNIKDNELVVPFKNLIRETSITKVSFFSIYREILFLIIVVLERELIDIDAFDTEYKEAFKGLIANEKLKEWIKKSDRPPNHTAVWCRRLFSPLLV